MSFLMGWPVVILNLHLLLCFQLVYLPSVHILTVLGTQLRFSSHTRYLTIQVIFDTGDNPEYTHNTLRQCVSSSAQVASLGILMHKTKKVANTNF